MKSYFPHRFFIVQSMIQKMKAFFVNKNRFFFTALLCFFLLFQFQKTALCAPQDAPSSDSWTVGISADTPPFCFQKAGKYVGFEIDLAQEIAKRMGRQLVLKEMDFSALIPSLKAGQLDTVIAMLQPTFERRQSLLFSQPYLQEPPALLLNQDGKKKSLLDFWSVLQTIGVQMGSTHDAMLRGLAQKKTIDIRVYNRALEGVQDLKAGRLTAFFMDQVVAQHMAKRFHLVVQPLLELKQEAAMAFVDPLLRQTVNHILQQLIDEGFVFKLRQKWAQIQEDSSETFSQGSQKFEKYWFIFKGIKITLFYTFFSLVGGAILGIGLICCRFSNLKILVFFSKSYVSIFRGTPLILQLWFIYYGLGHIFYVPWQAGILAFSFNSAAYLSEVIRSGILSLDQSQWDAGYVLGLSRFQVLKGIILPQAFRRQIPSFLNECCDLIKESALVSTITESDIMRRANMVAAESYEYVWPYVFAGACYYLFILGLTTLSNYYAKKSPFS